MIVKFDTVNELEYLLNPDKSYDEVDELYNFIENLFNSGAEEVEHNIPIPNFHYLSVDYEEYEIDYASCIVEIPHKGGSTKELDEVKLADEYIKQKLLICDNGIFYTARNGVIRREVIKNDITEILYQQYGVFKAVDSKAESIVKVIEVRATNYTVKGAKVVHNKNIIPLRNGTLFVPCKTFVENYYLPTLYRLDIDLKPCYKGVPALERWINNALNPEDVRAFKDYMGYLLVPNTDAQVCMFIIGDGSIGKSTLGNLLKSMWGDAFYNVTNMAEFLNNRFRLSGAINKLCAYDDDIGSTPLAEDGMFKNLISAKEKVLVEKKGKDVVESDFFARFLIFGNKMIDPPKQVDDGFTRRIIPIFTKARRENFVPDCSFGDKLLAEKHSILIYFLEGLYDLISEKYNFNNIISDASKEWRTSVRDDSDPIEVFFKDSIKVTSDASDFISNVDLIDNYKTYCRNNRFEYGLKADLEIKKWFRDHCVRLKFDKATRDNKRGYIGIKFINPDV